MFFIQQQLSEKPCGHWTEVSAYLFKESSLWLITIAAQSHPHQSNL
jgi:hypothetical protein